MKKMKILMVTMQMGIGGAETHILELSRALTARGYTVHVASRGGSFVPELEAAGIRHFVFPLNTRRPQDLLASYRGLKRLIATEHYDVVHAHARIPAALCGRLSRKLGFRFVTTAHWVFALTPLYRVLSDWGQRTLAVSEDIKQYLIDGYGVFPDNIRVTVNALDTEKFSPSVDPEPLREELGLSPDSLNIVCVSRMDRSRGEIPLLLARIASRLRREYPRIHILLIGGSALGGEESVLPEIERIIAEDTERDGESAVQLIGPRTDINRFCGLSDIFVGASRAALEAMSAARPVILAGNEGYTGILTEQNLSDAVRTNFCCRGSEAATEELLLRDVVALCAAGPEKRAALGAANRAFILENYGLDRMVSDALAVYRGACERKCRADILISGYYGFGNSGDDSLLTAILGELRKTAPDASVAVLAHQPRRAEKRFGVRCINRFNPFALLHAMRHARLFISSGGNLFQNGTSNKSLAYYVSVLRMAQRMHLKTMIYANGIGPLYGRRAERMTAKVVRAADAVTLREPDSLALLHRLVPDCRNLCLSADPALLLAPATPERLSFLLRSAGIPEDRRYVVVSLRAVVSRREKPGSAAEERFEREFAAELGEICEVHGLFPIFIPMQEQIDAPVCRRAARYCGRGAFLSGLTVCELLALMEHTAFVCGMRLHSLIYSLSAGIPFAALSYDGKVRSFAEYADMPYVLSAPSGWEPGALSRAANEILENREILVRRAKEKAAEFCRLAEADAEYAASLLR